MRCRRSRSLPRRCARFRLRARPDTRMRRASRGRPVRRARGITRNRGRPRREHFRARGAERKRSNAGATSGSRLREFQRGSVCASVVKTISPNSERPFDDGVRRFVRVLRHGLGIQIVQGDDAAAFFDNQEPAFGFHDVDGERERVLRTASRSSEELTSCAAFARRSDFAMRSTLSRARKASTAPRASGADRHPRHRFQKGKRL